MGVGRNSISNCVFWGKENTGFLSSIGGSASVAGGVVKQWSDQGGDGNAWTNSSSDLILADRFGFRGMMGQATTNSCLNVPAGVSVPGRDSMSYFVLNLASVTADSNNAILWAPQLVSLSQLPQNGIIAADTDFRGSGLVAQRQREIIFDSIRATPAPGATVPRQYQGSPLVMMFESRASGSVIRVNDKVLSSATPASNNTKAGSLYGFNGPGIGWHTTFEAGIFSACPSSTMCDALMASLMAAFVPIHTSLVVVAGDSLVAGVGSTNGNDYPSQLARMVPTARVVSLGVGSTQLGFDWNQVGGRALIAGALDTSFAQKVLVLSGGDNDCHYQQATNLTTRVANAWNDMKAVATNAVADGYDGVIVSTMGSGVWADADNDAFHTQFNATIVANWQSVPAIKGVARIDLLPTIGSAYPNSRYDSEMFVTGNLHNTNAGYGARAAELASVVRTYLAGTGKVINNGCGLFAA